MLLPWDQRKKYMEPKASRAAGSESGLIAFLTCTTSMVHKLLANGSKSNSP